MLWCLGSMCETREDTKTQVGLSELSRQRAGSYVVEAVTQEGMDVRGILKKESIDFFGFLSFSLTLNTGVLPNSVLGTWSHTGQCLSFLCRFFSLCLPSVRHRGS